MLISLALRWFAWLIALVIVVLQAAPEQNLVNAPIVLVITLLQLLGMSVYPAYLRRFLPERLSQSMPALWPIGDMAVALWAIYHTGGWNSPFYHFGITTVLAPSLRFGLWGAFLSSASFSAAYIWVIKQSPSGFSAAYHDSQPEPGLVSVPLNPVMVALYAAFLGEVLKKLAKEMERSRILARENERARMARDIHDGVSQTLFMLSMSLESGQILAQKESAKKTEAHLESLLPIAQKALIELRNTMYNVEPIAEGELSLDEALEQLSGDYRSATGQNIDFLLEASFSGSREVASTLFRLAQESLANACQHANAEKVQVRLGSTSLSIEDNGAGFDESQVKKGRGLDNLADRAQESGIEYHLNTSPEGTKVLFSWKENSAS